MTTTIAARYYAKLARTAAKAAGYTVARGSYLNTPDDRLDGWYVQHDGDTAIRRLGSGYRTQAEAWIAAYEHHNDLPPTV